MKMEITGYSSRFFYRLPLFAAALLLAISSLLLGASVVIAQEWPQFQNDAVNSGETPDTGPVTGVTLEWKQYTAGTGTSGINTTPVISGNKIYVLSIAGQVHAFNRLTGATAWSRDLGSAAAFPHELATPCYAEGKLFVAKQDGEVWALNGNNGSTAWGPVQLGSVTDQLNTPVTYADGMLYVGSSSGSKTYYCLDADNGNIIWSRAGTHGFGYYWAGACVIGDYLVYGDDGGWLTSVNKATGSLADEEDLASVWTGAAQIRSSITYDAGTGRVYFTDLGGCCWAYDFDPVTGNLTHEWHTYIGWSTSTPAVAGGRVYVGHGSFSSSGALHCLNETDGTKLWSFTPPNGGGVESSPVLSVPSGDTYIYFTANCADGAAYGLDSEGNQLWEYISEERGTPAGYVLQGVALADGLVYFGNDGGYLYSLINALPPWDVNQDEKTNALDVMRVISKLGQSGTPGWIPEDVNPDGDINALDVMMVISHLGE